MGSNWLGSVDGMTSLRLYRMIKEELKPKGYLKLLDSGDVRLRFRLRSGSARIRRGVVCVLMIGVCYVIVEDLVHFLSVCEEFREDRRLLLVTIESIAGAGAWVREMDIGSDEAFNR